ncbi:sarcocystatin-A-like [Drosophila eugracilis]|uniref:sarcocystatin-A-like n=1 Tax=Drosophila eugracilis TaxID=29029 RepID=UPI0007E7849D|nr:sarcocystatin-A-like [Drosophila eugracilis]
MFLAKILILCTACVLVNSQIPGGIRVLEGKDLADAKEILETSLSKLAAGEGPHYRISKIRSATVQVVSGSKHAYSVELIDNSGATKECNVKIWSQPWVPNGIEVTFNCPNEPEVVRRHSS